MSFPVKLISVAMTAALILPAADVITLKNGDRVTGAIIKKDGKTLTIKSEHFGVVTLPWEQVDSIKADQTLNVVLQDGKTVQSTLATKGDKVEVAQQTVAPAEIVVIRNADEQKAYERLQAPRLTDLWAGTGTIGWAGTRGNADTTTFTVGLNGARVTRTDKTFLYFNAVRASASVNNRSATTAQAVRGGWGYNRNLSPRMFVNTFNDYEYDRFQALDLRAVFGGGLGYIAWKGERGRLDLVGGAAYNHERFSPAPRPSFTRNSAEAYWGNDFSYKFSAATSFVQSYRMFNNLTNTGNYRMNFDAGANTRLTKWLTWNISLSNRYLSNPAPNRVNSDWLYTTGFGFTFAR